MSTSSPMADENSPDVNRQPETPVTQINTDGGPTIHGNVTAGGDLVGYDKIEGDKVGGDKTVIEQQTNIYQIAPPVTMLPATPRGIFGLHHLNEHFFGRDDELATLHTLLQTESNVSICPVITGMGGLGKTQLAAHYAHDHKDNYPDGIFWITAANLNDIRPQLADFCVALGLPVADPQRSGDLTEQKITAFKGYFDQHPAALLIFDNVEEPDHLRTRQIGVGLTALTLGGKVIVTTRRRKLPSDKFAELALQRLLPAPARQILITARPDLAMDPDLDRLCEQFGYLPLMLNLAAAALKKRGGAIAGYLQRVQTLGAEKLHSEVVKVSLDDYHKGLRVVLVEQWNMVRDENARRLLRVAGQLPEAAIIPIACLGLLSGLNDVDEWERALSDARDELTAASLIEGVNGQTIRFHPLVRDFAESLTPQHERAEFRTACAQRLTDAYINEQTGVLRLGSEYERRGIGALLVDLIVAIDLSQSPISSLQSLRRLLRLEADKLQGTPQSWQPRRLWQQILLSASQSKLSGLTHQLTSILQETLHWLPRWRHQSHLNALEQTLTGHKAEVLGVAVLDANRIVSASAYDTLKVWNLHTGAAEQTLAEHEGQVTTVAVLDANRIVSASADRTLKVWNLHTGAVEQTLAEHENWVFGVAVLDANRIVSASADRTLKVWNLHTGAAEQTLAGHEGLILGVTVLDANRIVSASADRTLKVWNLSAGAGYSDRIDQMFSGHKASMSTVGVVDGQRVVSASTDGTLNVCNLNTGAVEQTLAWNADWVNGITVFDAQHIIIVGNNNRLSIWNLDTGKVIYTPTRNRHIDHGHVVKVLDHEYVISVWKDRTLKIWNLHTGDIKQTFAGHKDIVKAVVVLDNQHIASASSDHTLKIWNMETGTLEQTLVGHEAGVLDMAMLDANRIVSFTGDEGSNHTLKVWNLQTGVVEQTLSGHEGGVNAVAVLDANRIISASNDRTLKAWDWQTGQVVASIELDGAPSCVAVARQDGRTLVVAGDAAGALYCLELVEPVGNTQ